MALSSDALAIIGILLTVVVAVGFFILGLRAGRPKLVAAGGGSGSIRVPNKDVMATSITIRNEPSFIGMRVKRGTAKIVSARVYDPELKEYVGHALMWRKNGSGELERECAIEAGSQKQLYVFAKERHSNEFFVFSGKSLDSEYVKPIALYKERKKDFSIHLHDMIGVKYRFDIVTRNADQSVGINFKITWRARWKIISEAIGLVRYAIFSR